MNKNLKDKQEFTGYQLKLIGLVLMVLDHIYYYFSPIYNIPIVFNWLGRLAAPIFVFLLVEGYVHTKDVKQYLKRLYLGFLGMNILNQIIVMFYSRPDDLVPSHSIFGSLFLIVIHLMILDKLFQSRKQGKTMKMVQDVSLLLTPSILSFLFLLYFDSIPGEISEFILTFVPTVFLVEGGAVFITLGLAFYAFRDNRKLQMIVYTMFSLTLLPQDGLNFHNLLFENYQWMMVLAVPLFNRYNGERGKDRRYLFYLFYPAHVYILYILSTILY